MAVGQWMYYLDRNLGDKGDPPLVAVPAVPQETRQVQATIDDKSISDYELPLSLSDLVSIGSPVRIKGKYETDPLQDFQHVQLLIIEGVIPPNANCYAKLQTMSNLGTPQSMGHLIQFYFAKKLAQERTAMPSLPVVTVLGGRTERNINLESEIILSHYLKGKVAEVNVHHQCTYSCTEDELIRHVVLGEKPEHFQKRISASDIFIAVKGWTHNLAGCTGDLSEKAYAFAAARGVRSFLLDSYSPEAIVSIVNGF
ncbi:MAG: hypothetical protein V1725_03345 [archaeon]